MKIAICGNHSFPSCGGSEKVIQQISEGCSGLSHDVTVFSRSINENFENNNVKYRRIQPSGIDFVNTIINDKFDHILVYSDLFCHWSSILDFAEKMSCEKSVVLVGANAILHNQLIQKKFRSKSHLFNVITHSSNYQDYQACLGWNIPVKVIPNGVDLNEFKSIDNNFREKFNVKSDHILLCVSNFFQGKGQEYLPLIIRDLQKKTSDKNLSFEVICIYSDMPYDFCTELEYKTKALSRGMPFRFLKNISRQDTINAFNCSSVFIFPSQKEVAPLVVIESMASSLPWISLPVGNTPELGGGLLMPFLPKNKNGDFLYSKVAYEMFSSKIYDLIIDEQLRKDIGRKGREMVEEKYNWSIISQKYNELFKKKD